MAHDLKGRTLRLWCSADTITLTRQPFGTGTITVSPVTFSVRRVVFSALRFGIRVICKIVRKGNREVLIRLRKDTVVRFHKKPL